MGILYSPLIIDKYLNGDDLDLDVDALENDPDFMLQVLKKSGDIKMYEFCSDSLKENADFVKSVIKLFPDNFEFLEEEVEPVLNNRAFRNQECIEINILMSELSPKSSNKYSNICNTIYLSSIVKIRSSIEELLEENPDSINDIGNGFVYFYLEYPDSEIIKSFAAKKMLEEAYGNGNLEKIVHANFSDFSDLEKMGKNRFITDLISQYDSFLWSYVINHEQLLDYVNRELDRTKQNWSKYMDRLNNWRVDAVEREAEYYVDDNYPYSNVFPGKIVFMSVGMLGLESIFEKYDEFYDGEYHDDCECTVEELDCINHMTKYIKRVFATKEIDNSLYRDNYVKKESESSDKEGIIIPFTNLNNFGNEKKY